MKAITFSLIIVVIFSSVSVGWLIDFTHTHLFPAATSDIQKKVSLLEISGKAIADSIALNDQTINDALLKKYNASKNLDIKLFSVDTIALPAFLMQQLKSGEALVLENKEGTSFWYYLSTSNQFLQVSSNTLFIEEDTTSQLVLTILFYLGLSLLLTLWAYPLTKRLYLIKAAAVSIGKGNLSTRLEVGSISGTKDVEMAFNSMASRIQALLYDVKLLSGGVSHDLKTSLARLRLGIDILEDDPKAISKTQIARLSQDTDDMIHLVNMMLHYTQLEMELSALAKDEVKLIDVLKDIVSGLSSHTDIKKINLTISETINQKGPNHYKILGNVEYLKIMLKNLISNAINYAEHEINILVNVLGSELIIQIQDDGPGIPEQFREDIFKPFFRIPESKLMNCEAGQTKQKTNEKHYGLGLAISQRIAQLHNGTILLNTNFTKRSSIDNKPSAFENENDNKRAGTELIVSLPC